MKILKAISLYNLIKIFVLFVALVLLPFAAIRKLLNKIIKKANALLISSMKAFAIIK